ncbi:MAG: hypothetical protein ACLUHN_07830 [Evtepia gabavorous]
MLGVGGVVGFCPCAVGTVTEPSMGPYFEEIGEITKGKEILPLNPILW